MDWLADAHQSSLFLQAVYPVALSIRATNVYEEKSMGVYDDDVDQDLDEAEAEFAKTRSATQYIG